MPDANPASENELSKKLNVLIALMLHLVTKDEKFNDGKGKTGDLVAFLRRHSLSYEDISAILDSPIGSVRELASRKRRTKQKVKRK
jgi:hypothetical protein